MTVRALASEKTHLLTSLGERGEAFTRCGRKIKTFTIGDRQALTCKTCVRAQNELSDRALDIMAHQATRDGALRD